MSILSQMSDEAKRNTTVVGVVATGVSWLTGHSPEITALVGCATLIWIMLGIIERVQRIFLTWKHGLNHTSGDE